MAKNRIQDGNILNVTNGTGATVASGSGIKVGGRVAIALVDIASGASGSADFAGVWSHAKATGASTGGVQGADAYWNDTTKNFTAVASGNTKAGFFAATCADGDATCRVVLNR